jgi:hypothetical protein
MSRLHSDYLSQEKLYAREYSVKMGLIPHKDSVSNAVKWGYSFETRLRKKDSQGNLELSMAGNPIHCVTSRKRMINGRVNPLATLPAITSGIGLTKKLVKEKKIKTYKPWSLK